MKTSSLKRIANKYTQTSLILRILIGMAIGVVLALTVPEFTGIKILGDLFVGALKAIAPLLVCLLIMSSLAQTKEGHYGTEHIKDYYSFHVSVMSFFCLS